MWEETLQTVLERYGLAAAIMVGVLIGLSYVIRTLWNDNKELRKDLNAMEQRYRDDVTRIHMEEHEKRHSMRMAFNQEVQHLSKRIDELQEKRVNAAQSVTETVVEHVAHTRHSVDKITTAMETLTEMVVGRLR